MCIPRIPRNGIRTTATSFASPDPIYSSRETCVCARTTRPVPCRQPNTNMIRVRVFRPLRRMRTYTVRRARVFRPRHAQSSNVGGDPTSALNGADEPSGRRRFPLTRRYVFPWARRRQKSVSSADLPNRNRGISHGNVAGAGSALLSK